MNPTWWTRNSFWAKPGLAGLIVFLGVWFFAAAYPLPVAALAGLVALVAAVKRPGLLGR